MKSYQLAMFAFAHLFNNSPIVKHGTFKGQIKHNPRNNKRTKKRKRK